MVKLGLALSGGGFRAAFFHLGTMAQLARRGLLRHVEVISTVSGGSIIGAYYLIGVKRLLETQSDSQLRNGDLQELIQNIEEDFLSVVQRNMRLRTLTNLGANLKMARPQYSRSDRFADLLDKEFYLPLWRQFEPGRDAAITMRDLVIKPHGHRGPFVAREHNETRKIKVPELIVNATTLNTGHVWRFTSETMGEPIRRSRWEWDADRSLSLSTAPGYADVVGAQTNIRLADAVAASAAVPGLFQPMPITGLYDFPLQLVDGGVFENQGIDALLDRHCTHVVISDAGGQLIDQVNAPSWALGVLFRSSAIQYGRVRQLQLQRLRERISDEKIAFVHAMKGVRTPSAAWIGPTGVRQEIPSAQLPREEESLIDPETQKLLADIRTDLDSFSEIEARSLMASGYVHADGELQRAEDFRPLERVDPVDQRWDFLDVLPWLTGSPSGPYRRSLRAARSRFLKPFRLTPLRALGIALVAYGVPLMLLSWPIWLGRHWLARRWNDLWDWVHSLADLAPVRWFLELAPVEWLLDVYGPPAWVWIPSLAAGAAIMYLIVRYLPAKLRTGGLSWLRRATPAINRLTSLARAVTAVLAWLFVWASLLTLDRLFLWQGQADKLRSRPH